MTFSGMQNEESVATFPLQTADGEQLEVGKEDVRMCSPPWVAVVAGCSVCKPMAQYFVVVDDDDDDDDDDDEISLLKL